MRAVVVSGAQSFAVKQVERPVRKSKEALIRVLAGGICGTDIEILDGTMAYFTGGLASYPITPGHEWVGEIVEVSSGSEFEIGDRVVGECSVGCGDCERCVRGRYHQCANRTETGIMNRDGGFAEFISFPERNLFKVSRDVPVASAALVEPTAIALNGVLASEVGPLDRLAIVGDGSIGLLALMVAKNFGPKEITLIGRNSARLKVGEEIGVTRTINVDETDPAEYFGTSTNVSAPNVVIEATGYPDAVAASVKYIEAGGRLVLQGLFGGRMLNQFNLDDVVVKDLRVRGALGSPGIWSDAIELIEKGKVDPSLLVGHKFSLDLFGDAVEVARSGGAIKVVIEQKTA